MQICGFLLPSFSRLLKLPISHIANPRSSPEKRKTTCKRIDRFQSRDHFTIGRHIGAPVNSELVSRELSVVTNQGEETRILSEERRKKWISAISRKDVTDSILEL